MDRRYVSKRGRCVVLRVGFRFFVRIRLALMGF